MKSLSIRFLILAGCLSGSLLFFSADALAAPTGKPVQLSVGSLPAPYEAYWVSDLDGYLGHGNPFTMKAPSIGNHQITVYIYDTRRQQVAQRLQGEVRVDAPTTPTARNTPLITPGEYENTDLLLLGCASSYTVEDVYPAILKALAGTVRTEIWVDNEYTRYELMDLFRRHQIPQENYEFVIAPIDTIWMRDYGPLSVKRGHALEVVDLAYYPGRDADDSMPARFARRHGLPHHDLPLYWEGGNFMTDGNSTVWASQTLTSRNPRNTPQQIERKVGDLFGGALHTLSPMKDDGGTGHIDMFAKFVGPSTVLVNSFPRGHSNFQRMNQHSEFFSDQGHRVIRISLADNRYSSYSNSLLVNGIALVPTYGQPDRDSKALALYRSLGFQAVGIDSRRLIQWAGAIHCITMTVPQQ